MKSVLMSWRGVQSCLKNIWFHMLFHNVILSLSAVAQDGLKRKNLFIQNFISKDCYVALLLTMTNVKKLLIDIEVFIELRFLTLIPFGSKWHLNCSWTCLRRFRRTNCKSSGIAFRYNRKEAWSVDLAVVLRQQKVPWKLLDFLVRFVSRQNEQEKTLAGIKKWCKIKTSLRGASSTGKVVIC